MPIELYNALVTFQSCMIDIFLDMNERFLKIFMDNFTLYRLIFEAHLHILSLVLVKMRRNKSCLELEKMSFYGKRGQFSRS